jgi:BrnA antitoxin of type II toxin-antitoxin system
MRKEHDFTEGKRGAVLPVPAGKMRVTIRLDEDVLEWFRDQVDQAAEAITKVSSIKPSGISWSQSRASGIDIAPGHPRGTPTHRLEKRRGRMWASSQKRRKTEPGSRSRMGVLLSNTKGFHRPLRASEELAQDGLPFRRLAR